MIKKGHKIEGAPVLVLGITFKENCPDIRNSRVIDVISELQSFGCVVETYDPWADKMDVKHEYGTDILTHLDELKGKKYSAIVAAVAHREFEAIDLDMLMEKNAVVYDIKAILPKDKIDARL
jgi:UDP-N-acetyl-D-galactosamine dehydrogenase